MRLIALLLVLLTPALTACSGDGGGGDARAEVAAHEEDRAVAEWRAAVEDELGTATFDFGQAVATVQESADPLDLVCDPGVELSSEDALRADLVCAHR